MKITALAPWFGSKRTLAPRIVEALGPHRAYWEPFCGSMSVLLSKKPATMETVNDLHGDLINMARVVQHPQLGPKLYRQLRRVWFCQDTFREVQSQFRTEGLYYQVPNAIDLERAVRFAIHSWMGRNGTIGSNGGNTFCVRYTANGGNPAKRWRSWVESLPAFAKRLQGVIILREDAFSLLERVEDNDGVAIYADPPYLSKSAKYVHDLAAGDHHRLAELLGRFRQTRVVVSYYDDQRLDEMYPGWLKLDCATAKPMVNIGKRDRKGESAKAPEVLLINQRAEGLFA